MAWASTGPGLPSASSRAFLRRAARRREARRRAVGEGREEGEPVSLQEAGAEATDASSEAKTSSSVLWPIWNESTLRERTLPASELGFLTGTLLFYSC